MNLKSLVRIKFYSSFGVRQFTGADSGDGGQAFHLKADSESGRSRTAFR